MKYSLIIALLTASVFATSCSGNRADKENADTMYKYTDTNKATIDTNSRDSVHANALDDTTMNAPRMPERK
ncbi:hypothetical protein [Pedobacter endophyticus]|uniref:Lipoprotein n=1 Tax=Pedobacter endophyticus TaxID=2789740 RepID=A0A7S9PY99_9SPHI|nr:hypothetical protein [Pedobacter endophyticus]QPH39018.1 hypothetical protein IZT61_18440 [Pedobacter endophyticus]